MIDAEPAKKSKREYRKHGFTTMKRAVRRMGARVIDKRTSLGKALLRWKAQLVTDLGGAEAISVQEHALIDLCVKSKLMLDSIDNWLLVQPSLINMRRKCLLPVVRERQALADGLSRYLGQLGLERRAKPVLSLMNYLSAGKKAEGEKGSDS